MKMNEAQADDARLEQAIDALVGAIRSERSGAAERADLQRLMGQVRSANQNLIMAAVRAAVMKEEAESRARQQNEFLAMLAHELRNPLAPLANAASVLERLVDAHPLLPRLQEVIGRQVDHMARLVDDLLDASRITSGRVGLRMQDLALDDVIERSLEVVRPAIERRRQNLEVDVPVRLPNLRGDAVRLSQALSNLLVNASKFTPESGSVGLRVSTDEAGVHLVVSDTGVGIEPGLLPQVFELFRQGSRSMARSEGGLGIGLSVAKALVERHGGTITARSAGPGHGSEFDVYLPKVGQPEPTEAPEPPATP